MASYTIQAPNGQTYTIEGPEGASQSQVVAALLAVAPDAGNPAGQGGAAAAQPAADTGGKNDAWERYKAATAGGLRAMTSVGGATNRVSRWAEEKEQKAEAAQSEREKALKERSEEIKASGKGKGIVQEATAQVKGIMADLPGHAIDLAGGLTAPILATAGAASMLTGVGEAAGLGATAAAGLGALVAGGAVGGATGVGMTKNALYDTIKGELKAQGVPEKDAEAKAQEAQETFGPNSGNILTAGALNALLGASLPGPIAKAVSKKVVGAAVAQKAAGQALAEGATEKAAGSLGKTVLKHAAVTGAEMGTAMGQGQYAVNRGLSRAGIETPAFEGVPGAVTGGLLTGSVLGGTIGGVSKGRERYVARKKDVAADAKAEQERLAAEGPEAERHAGLVERFGDDDAAAIHAVRNPSGAGAGGQPPGASTVGGGVGDGVQAGVGAPGGGTARGANAARAAGLEPNRGAAAPAGRAAAGQHPPLAEILPQVAAFHERLDVEGDGISDTQRSSLARAAEAIARPGFPDSMRAENLRNLNARLDELTGVAEPAAVPVPEPPPINRDLPPIEDVREQVNATLARFKGRGMAAKKEGYAQTILNAKTHNLDLDPLTLHVKGFGAAVEEAQAKVRDVGQQQNEAVRTAVDTGQPPPQTELLGGAKIGPNADQLKGKVEQAPPPKMPLPGEPKSVFKGQPTKEPPATLAESLAEDLGPKTSEVSQEALSQEVLSQEAPSPPEETIRKLNGTLARNAAGKLLVGFEGAADKDVREAVKKAYQEGTTDTNALKVAEDAWVAKQAKVADEATQRQADFEKALADAAVKRQADAEAKIADQQRRSDEILAKREAAAAKKAAAEAAKQAKPTAPGKAKVSEEGEVVPVEEAEAPPDLPYDPAAYSETRLLVEQNRGLLRDKLVENYQAVADNQSMSPELLKDRVLREIADRKGMTPEQLAHNERLDAALAAAKGEVPAEVKVPTPEELGRVGETAPVETPRAPAEPVAKTPVERFGPKDPWERSRDLYADLEPRLSQKDRDKFTADFKKHVPNEKLVERLSAARDELDAGTYGKEKPELSAAIAKLLASKKREMGHPVLPRTSIRRNAEVIAAIRKGDLRGVVQAIADTTKNPALAKLAQSMLDSGFAENTKLDLVSGEPGMLGETDPLTGHVRITEHGLTEETPLHEALHSWIAARFHSLDIYSDKYTRDLLQLDKQRADEFIDKFSSLWDQWRVGVEKNHPDIATENPAVLTAMNSLDEFLTRSQADPDVQAFLRTHDINGKPVEPKSPTSVWNKFLGMVRNMFGAKPARAALDQVMDAGNNILDAGTFTEPDLAVARKVEGMPEPQPAAEPQPQPTVPPAQAAKAQAAKIKLDAVDYHIKGMDDNLDMAMAATKQNHAADKAVLRDFVNSLDDGAKAQDADTIVDGFIAAAGGKADEVAKSLPPAFWEKLNQSLPSSSIVTLTEKAVPFIGEHATIDGRIRGFINRQTEYATNLGRKLREFVGKNGQDMLSRMTNGARLADFDSFKHENVAAALRDDKGMVKLKEILKHTTLSDTDRLKAENDLDLRSRIIEHEMAKKVEFLKQPGAEEAYRRLQDYYRDTGDASLAYRKRFIDDFTDMSPEGRDNLQHLLQAMEEEVLGGGSNARHPDYAFLRTQDVDKVYFPFAREGRHWIRVPEMPGEPMGRQYYKFKSAGEMFRFKDLLAKRMGVTVDDIQHGHTTEGMLKNAANKHAVVRKLINMIDELPSKKGMSKRDMAKQRDLLKDRLSQYALELLTEGNPAVHGLHAEDVVGFSSDVLKTYQDYALKHIGYLTGLKFSPEVERYALRLDAFLRPEDTSLDATGMTQADRAKYEVSANILVNRLQRSLHPDPGSKIVAEINKAGYLMYLTGATSAAINFSTLPIRLLPRLNNHFGAADTTRVASKYMLQPWSSFGVMKARDGNLKLSRPSVRHSEIVRSSPTLMRLYNGGAKLGAFDTALTTEINSAYNTPFGKTVGGAYRTLTALFATTEVMSREVAFMSLAELKLKQLNKKGKGTPAEREQEAIDFAAQHTNETMGNYGVANRPDWMNHPVGKLVGLFKMYGLNQMDFYLKYGRKILNSDKTLTKMERYKAFEEMTGTILMGALFHGAVGLPFFTLAATMVDLFHAAHDSDEEKRARRLRSPLFAGDAAARFKYEYMHDHFGATKFQGASGRTHDLANFLLHGPFSEMTDTAVGARTSQDNMLIRSGRAGDNVPAAVVNAVTANIPGASLLNSGLSGVDDLSEGHYARALEKLLPAAGRGLATAYRAHEEGLRNRKGDIIVPQDDIEFTDYMKMIAGVQPQRIRTLTEFKAAEEQRFHQIEQEKTKIIAKGKFALDMIADGRVEQGRAELRKVMAQQKRHNEETVGMPRLQVTDEAVWTAYKGLQDRRMLTLPGGIHVENLEDAGAVKEGYQATKIHGKYENSPSKEAHP